jgi:microcystin-dependent protein
LLLERLEDRTLLDGTTGPAGGGTPFPINQPALALQYMIAVAGIFPPPSGSNTNGAGEGQFLGEVHLFAGTFVPGGWLPADGRLLSIAQDTALFSLLGTTYGGDGVTTFALPDLRGRVAVEVGQGPGLTARKLADKYGAETHTLSEAEMPAHTHSLPGGGTTAPDGNNQPIDIAKPSLGLNYIIAEGGIFSFLGEVRLFAGNFAPDGWVFADGRVLSIAQDTALLSIIGTTYGGDGVTTFKLPDLRGRTPIEAGQGPGLTERVEGTPLGAETVTLPMANLPAHLHSLPGGSLTGVAGSISPSSFDIMQPSLVINYIIATSGIFPDPNGGTFGEGERLLGEIRPFAGTAAPQGWLLCDGQVLSIAQNTALFSLMGATYGGNGTTTFALPDLRGRAAEEVGQGPGLSNRTLGQMSGVEGVTLLSANLPIHEHTFVFSNVSASGTVFADPNGDGVRQAGEPGLKNWMVDVIGANNQTFASGTTDQNGNFTIPGIGPGIWTLKEELQAGWKQTAPKPVPPGTFSFTPTSGGNLTGDDFGDISLAPPPTANGQSVTAQQNIPTLITLTGTAPNGDALSFAVATPPAHGMLGSINQSNGQVIYTPNANYTGPDGFTFTVTDTTTDFTSVAATVSINVTPPAAAFIYDWNGSQSSDWFNAQNWTDVNNGAHHAVPGPADTAVIMGGPFNTVQGGNATVAALQVSGGFLTINAALTDAGPYSQDAGFVAFGANADRLQIAGNVNRAGGVFFGPVGTVVLNGTAGQTVMDTSFHPFQNLLISNSSAAGVTLPGGSNVGASANVSLNAGSLLTLLQGVTASFLTAGGNFSDNGTLVLDQLSPNGGSPTALVKVTGTLALSASSAFVLAVGSPAANAVYTFMDYGTATGQGNVGPGNIVVQGCAPFTPMPSFGAGSLTVTLTSPGIIDTWTGGTDSSWFNPANWSAGAVPGTADTAVIKGAPNDPVLTANAAVGNLTVSGGFLTIQASLTDNGAYNQDAGFVAFGADANQLTIDGEVSHLGGFLSTNGHGTVLLAGSAAQNVVDHSGHALPNISITNSSAAGVTLAAGSTVGATSLSLAAGSALNLSVPAPGNAAAPLIVSGAVTLGSGSHLNLAMGGPSSGATYLFIQYGSVVDNGVVFGFSGQGGFTPTAHKNANSLTVTLA